MKNLLIYKNPSTKNILSNYNINEIFEKSKYKEIDQIFIDVLRTLFRYYRNLSLY